ncbi:family 43 glycosylhydrolase [Thermophagus sp. OGC60D27]|uniref:family 43 glycosylhydrolase n=1 Tax=Thermophagus sp. OGC60D27 TaxID=3458415 RepID=UPI0040377276
MKRIGFFIILMLVVSQLSAQHYTRDVAKIKAEISARNKAVHVFHDWMRDPVIMIGPDGYYYLSVTQHGDETPDGREIIDHGVPVYRSKDLAEWEFIGYPYTIEDADNYEQYVKLREERNADPGPWGPDHLKLWAPELFYLNNRWVVTHTSNAGIGNLALTEGSELEGPWDGWGEDFGRQHDPTIFTDDDGTHWLVSKCAQLQKLKPDLSGFDGKPVHISPSNRKMGHEGAFIIKFEDQYIFFGTAWSRDTLRHGTYNLYYTVSDKLKGPYGERKFAGRFLGHGTPFKDKEGNWWCTAFYNANHPTLSREEARTKDVSQSAYTLNKQGLTLVPIEIKKVDGEIVVRALDPDYEKPGDEEVQNF